MFSMISRTRSISELRRKRRGEIGGERREKEREREITGERDILGEKERKREIAGERERDS